MTWREEFAAMVARDGHSVPPPAPPPRYDDDGCSGRGNEFSGAGDVTNESLGEGENSADNWN